jgi:hypothetical protein
MFYIWGVRVKDIFSGLWMLQLRSLIEGSKPYDHLGIRQFLKKDSAQVTQGGKTILNFTCE